MIIGNSNAMEITKQKFIVSHFAGVKMSLAVNFFVVVENLEKFTQAPPNFSSGLYANFQSTAKIAYNKLFSFF